MRMVSRRPPGMVSAQVPHQSGSSGEPADPGLLADPGLPAGAGGAPVPLWVCVQAAAARGRDLPGERDASDAPESRVGRRADPEASDEPGEPGSMAVRRSAVIVRLI